MPTDGYCDGIGFIVGTSSMLLRNARRLFKSPEFDFQKCPIFWSDGNSKLKKMLKKSILCRGSVREIATGSRQSLWTQASEALLAMARPALRGRRGRRSWGLGSQGSPSVLAAQLDLEDALHLGEDGLKSWLKIRNCNLYKISLTSKMELYYKKVPWKALKIYDLVHLSLGCP